MTPPASADLLADLVNLRSVHTDTDYSAITDHVIARLEPLGVRCHRMANADGTRAGLFAAVGPKGPGGVLLSAHLDTVPVEGQNWTLDPFGGEIRDGRLYGRGSCDMKGFAACALRAMELAAVLPLRQPLKLAFSYDEESGCVGIADMIDSLESTIGLPDVCLVGEPTLMQIAVGHKGKISYRVTCRGEPGHSSNAPQYLNALHLAGDVMRILRDLQERLAKEAARDEMYGVPHATVHVGSLHGGTALNVIPAEAVLEFEIRYLSGDDIDSIVGDLRASLDACVARHRSHHPAAAIEIELINHYPGFDAPADCPAPALIEKIGGRLPQIKVDYGTDGGVFAQSCGLPVVVCGPGNIEQAHKPDEFIALDQLAACDAMLDRLLDHLSRT